ncbi:MAG: serine/threonine-protein kinase, partial [Pirellulaceae bacterium]
ASAFVRQGLLTEYQSDQLKAGRTKLNLGPYIITDFIGQGGMGQVFKGVHNVMGRECAVKVLPLEKVTDETRAHFLHEIRLQASLDCPYLVRAFDAGQDGKIHYLVTEFVPGSDLRRHVKKHGALPISEAALYIHQAALGLDYAHQQGLVHRDVKPGNILVTPSGRAKVSDVGLAAWSTAMSNDPRAGKIVGTADYLSPEQIMTPDNIGPASDIYGLGCTLYYCICGKVPYPGGNTASKCRRHCESLPMHPRKFAEDIPEEFVDIIADMMEKDPNDRIVSAAEVAARLEPWLDDIEALGERPMTRGPWLAPPPPGGDLYPPPMHGSGQISASGDTSDSAAVSQPGYSCFAQQRRSAPTHAGVRIDVRGASNNSMKIAVALAIAIPISLMIGRDHWLQSSRNHSMMIVIPCVVQNDAFASNEANHLISDHATYIGAWGRVALRPIALQCKQ